MSGEHFYIYVAHAPADRDRAAELGAALEGRGRRVYVPRARPGEDCDAADARALLGARVCVALITAQGLADARQRATIAAAIRHVGEDPHERRLIPVLLDGQTVDGSQRHLGLSLVMPCVPEAVSADAVAEAARRIDDVARRLGLDRGEPERARIAIVAVEEELRESSRAVCDALAPIGRVGAVERLDAASPETSGLLAGFDFVVGLVGARLGRPGLFQSLLGREPGALLRLKDVNIKAILKAERGDVLDLHEQIDDLSCFTNAEGAAVLAHQRVTAWLHERYPTPSGGAGLLEPWERDYLRAKLGEWAGSRHGPLAAYAGERDLRRVALYVSLHAVAQPWCHADEEGRLVVKPREEGERVGRGAADKVGPEGRDERGRAPFLEQVLSHAGLPVVVLEGEGGSGKTVLLQHVAYVLACRHLGEPAPEGHHLDLGALQKGAPLLRVPVLLDARRIGEQVEKHGTESAVREALAAAFSGAAELGAGAVLDGLKHGRYLLLVDALDEVPGVALRDKVVHALAGEARKGWPLRLVLTTRPAAYTGVGLPRELPALPLAPMNAGDAERLIERWAAAQGRPAEERGRIREAVMGVRERHGIDNVLENPLLLTCLLLVYEQRKRLPDSTAALYERMVEVLCTARDWPDVKPEDKRQALELVCAGMQEQGGTAWALELAVQALVGWRPALVPAGDRGEEFVKRLALQTGLLRLELHSDERGADVRLVRPWHRSFQEYLAARALAGGGDSVEMKTKRLFEPRANGSVRVEDPAWEGVLRFLVGVHGAAGDDNARRHVETLHASLRRRARPKREGRILGLAASALSEYAEHFAGHALLEALPREIVEAFEERGAKWPWRDRVLALEALGRLPGGDPRLKRDPWVRVKAGRFEMGGDDQAWGAAPKHAVEVGEFWMRRWPVTVSEYVEFVDGGGYRAEQWWDGSPGESEPWDWAEQKRHPNRPVVGVSWFEARAFCRWAKCAGWAPQGCVITLATEEEWEYASRGGEGRRYAWGDEPPGEGDLARASHDWRDGDTPVAATPVGAFPSGHSPEGLWDLAGNVWEWTACRWREPEGDWRQSDTECHQDDIDCHFGDNECHQDDKSGDKVTPPSRLKSLRAAPRVVRGGSWDLNPRSLRAACRDWSGPGDRDHRLGFRVVCRGSRQHVEP